MTSESRARDFAWISAAYAVALAVALAVGSTIPFTHPIAIAASADVAATFAVFAFSMIFRNSSFYDAYWSVAPPVIALYWILSRESDPASAMREAMVVGLVGWWAVRLTFNWARSWGGVGHEDWRYVDFRNKTGPWYWIVSLGGIHMAPTLWVLLGCLSLYPVFAVSANPFGWLDAVATIVTAGAITLEMRADKQLRVFRTKPGRTPEDLLSSGVWAWSRHPNYFGEVAFWWGLYLFGLAANPDWAWTIIGPLSITLLFRFISLPLIETRMLERRPSYNAYAESTSILIPWKKASS